MRIVKDKIWTRLVPEADRTIDQEKWIHSGGKWILFDSKMNIEDIADKLGPLIDSGEIESAKYWNGDPSAINVYSIDEDREKNLAILNELGAGNHIVWEYDYALCKNLKTPFHFAYSWYSKFSTILRSYGLRGSLELLRELTRTRNE